MCSVHSDVIAKLFALVAGFRQAEDLKILIRHFSIFAPVVVRQSFLIDRSVRETRGFQCEARSY